MIRCDTCGENVQGKVHPPGCVPPAPAAEVDYTGVEKYTIAEWARAVFGPNHWADWPEEAK